MMKMCHYDQQRTGHPSQAAGTHSTGLRSLSPPRGKVFNPFVAFLQKLKEKKGKGRSWDRTPLISLSSCDIFRLMLLTLFLQMNSRRTSPPHSQTRTIVAIFLL